MMGTLEVTAREWQSELERELQDNILPFWLDQAKDDLNGGFVGEIRSDLTREPEADKGLVLNARILWTFSCAYRVYDNPLYLDMARRAYNVLYDTFRDREYGGLYWMTDATGEPVQDKKQVYGQAFAIYALSEYVRAKGPRSEEALDWAIALYKLLEKHAYDPVHRGYVEALARDWSETDDLSLSEKDLNVRKSMNTHLHVLEGYTNLYRVWKPAGLQAKLAELIDVHLEQIVTGDNRHFLLFFDEAWNACSDRISYGHDIEGSWLLVEAAEQIGDPARLGRVTRTALAMAEATLAEGVDADGGVWNEMDEQGRLDDRKEWWPQAEAIVGFLNAYELTGDERFWQAARNSWDFTSRYLIDRENGEWHWRVSRDGVPDLTCVKAGPWKCPYHNSRACIEAIERIERIVANKEAQS